MGSDGGEDFKQELGRELTRAHREGAVKGGIEHLTWGEVLVAVLVTCAVAGVVIGFYEMIGWFASW